MKLLLNGQPAQTDCKTLFALRHELHPAPSCPILSIVDGWQTEEAQRSAAAGALSGSHALRPAHPRGT